MPKINITIADDLKEMLQELADDSGDSLSAVAADCIKLGVVTLIEGKNKMQIYRKMRDERKRRQNEQNKND